MPSEEFNDFGMSRPGIEPVTSRSPERILYRLSNRGLLSSDIQCINIYVLLHVSRCLVCKLNSLWRLLNEKKNVETRDYLQISYAHDSSHFDFRSNYLLIMCSVDLNRGLTIYFIVFKGFP